MENYDLIVIGSGPGGYPAAIKAAQAGLKVALIDAGQLGGTCLNRGCIPSKALIAAAEVWHTVQQAEEFGIKIEKASFDYAKMVERQEKVVDHIRKSLEQLLLSNGVVIIRGHAKFSGQKEIKVLGEDAGVLQAEKIIIASGSEPMVIPAFPCDGERIHDSTSLLKLKKLPKKLTVIGGGVIGCEFASMFHLLGVEVVILELLPRIIPTEGPDISKALSRIFKKRGIEIHTEVMVESIEKCAKGVSIQIREKEPVVTDMALVSVGRAVNSNQLDLNRAAIPVNKRGAILVNNHMETQAPGIYAIGDVIGKWWLAHVATHQGLIAVNHILGHRVLFSELAVPSVIYTTPEVATVGLSLEQAKEDGYAAEVGAFPFMALGKSLTAGHPDGFAQVVIDRNTKQILGAQVIGCEASTMIAEMALAIQNELTTGCVIETIHAHPTLSEAWMEATWFACGTPLHLPPIKRVHAKA